MSVLIERWKQELLVRWYYSSEQIERRNRIRYRYLYKGLPLPKDWDRLR